MSSTVNDPEPKKVTAEWLIALLIREKESLETRLGQQRSRVEEPVVHSTDDVDGANEVAEQIIEEAIAGPLRHLLNQVTTTLELLRCNPTIAGRCLTCGAELDYELLEMHPHMTFCKEHRGNGGNH